MSGAWRACVSRGAEGHGNDRYGSFRGGLTAPPLGLIWHRPGGITPLAIAFTKFREALRRADAVAVRQKRGRKRVDFANLPHDYAETLELVFVGLTIVVTLGILVAFGQWWQR
jgi:hypothetical protein